VLAIFGSAVLSVAHAVPPPPIEFMVSYLEITCMESRTSQLFEISRVPPVAVAISLDALDQWVCLFGGPRLKMQHTVSLKNPSREYYASSPNGRREWMGRLVKRNARCGSGTRWRLRRYS
jgi:hypothetical protein